MFIAEEDIGEESDATGGILFALVAAVLAATRSARCHHEHDTDAENDAGEDIHPATVTRPRCQDREPCAMIHRGADRYSPRSTSWCRRRRRLFVVLMAPREGNLR